MTDFCTYPRCMAGSPGLCAGICCRPASYESTRYVAEKLAQQDAEITALRARVTELEAERDGLIALHDKLILMLHNMRDERDAVLAAADADKVREACAKVVQCQCEKCGGAGWLWGHELEDYDPPHPGQHDDTRYSCDGIACKHANAIHAIPLPDHVALLAEAMRLPEIAALVEALRDAAAALEGFVNVSEEHRKPYEHPLSAYDRAQAALAAVVSK